MKRIALLSLPDPKFSPSDPGYEANRVDYRVLCEQCIRVPLDRQSGASIDEMRRGIRVLDALDRAKDEVLELEDADWEHLVEKVKRMPWGMVDRRFIRFYDDVCLASDEPRARQDGIGKTDGVAAF
jgi:hypothetical protein